MLCVSVMTRAELQYGLKRLPAGHRLHSGVRQFLKIVRVLPWDAEAADFYASPQVLRGAGMGKLSCGLSLAAHFLTDDLPQGVGNVGLVHR